MDHIKLKARAKINLTLDVTGKLENGYHSIESIMQSVSLYDEIYFKKTHDPGIKLKTNLPWLPADERNLVYKAINLILSRHGISEGVFADIEKHIPVGAGLGGGSADCATAIFAMNRLFGLGLSKAAMLSYCRELGSDIPFCLLRGTALASGVGDELTPLPPPPDFYILLATPPISVSTAFVYRNLDLAAITDRPDTKAAVRAITDGDLPGLAAQFKNVLETVTLKHFPRVAAIKERLAGTDAVGVLMSGSGPTVFAAYTDRAKAAGAAGIMKTELGLKEVFVTRLFNNTMKG